jgi:hypothetical protein
MTRLLIPIVLFWASLETVSAQDTTIYRQANADMFSNTYKFIKQNKSDNNGIFIQRSGTDDMQHWYGEGTFTETKNFFFLKFDTLKFHNRIETALNAAHSDTLYIKWFNWSGMDECWFSVRPTDTTLNIVYSSDLLAGFVMIPKKELSTKELTLYAYSSDRKVISFSVPDNVDEINIYANDTETMHTFNKTKENLKKNKKGFRTIGMWTEGEATQFIIRQ